MITVLIKDYGFWEALQKQEGGYWKDSGSRHRSTVEDGQNV